MLGKIVVLSRAFVNVYISKNLFAIFGVFVPGEYGEYPADHSRDGYAGKLGKSLPDVESYADLFVFRDPAHRWLLDSRPRDAHNTHDLQLHGGRITFDETCWFGRPGEMRNRRRSVSWFVHCYVHADGGDDVLPLSEDVLDGVQIGGARNYGFGTLSVADTQTVELEVVDFSRLEAAQRSGEACRVELVTPFVLESEHPGADSQSVPWWWGVEEEEVRRRETRLVDRAESHVVTTIDHGQVVPYTGTNIVQTTVNGVLRVGTHSRFGFGELRVRPVDSDRVPERIGAVIGGGM